MAIRVSLTGRVSIEAEGVRVDEEHFPGRQGRLVFAYLLAEHGRPVPRDELAEELWSGELPETWVKALAVLVSKLRVMLEASGVDGIVITSAFGCYKLTLPEGAWVDLTAADDALQRAEGALAAGDLAEARSSATTAIELARGELLPGEHGSWVEERRRRLQGVLLRAYECHADAGLGSGQATESMRSAEQVVGLEPFRESGYRRLMQAHIAAGNSAEALTVYERCRQLLAEELGAYPSPEIERLYLEILRAPTGAVAIRADAEAALQPVVSEPPARSPRSLTRRRLAIVAGALALAGAGVALVLTIGGGAESEARAITGAWAAVDHDGSSQTMEVTRGAARDSYDLTLEDSDAQACGGGPVTGEGAGTAVGDQLVATINLVCASGAKLEFDYPLTYRSADDTIVDPVGVVWSRADGGD